ncbi:OmpA family protein [Caviibacter abscessus]|uniref:OmpA family protein n=1 Tax=Caviibacter abscessus TaxID=1766719 RepID=UPI000838B56A|nr:OmpA family protein [Caviibacter abscessus]
MKGYKFKIACLFFLFTISFAQEKKDEDKDSQKPLSDINKIVTVYFKDDKDQKEKDKKEIEEKLKKAKHNNEKTNKSQGNNNVQNEHKDKLRLKSFNEQGQPVTNVISYGNNGFSAGGGFVLVVDADDNTKENKEEEDTLLGNIAIKLISEHNKHYEENADLKNGENYDYQKVKKYNNDGTIEMDSTETNKDYYFASNIKLVRSIAIGFRSRAYKSGIAIGDYSFAKKGVSMAIGHYAVAKENSAMAIGVGALASGEKSLAMMRQSAALGKYSISIGTVSAATKEKSIALGHGAVTKHENAISLGADSEDKEFVAKPSLTYNGINYKDFKGSGNNTNVLKKKAEDNNSKNRSVLSIGKKDYERQLVNLAPGEISETSTDAINGSQIYSILKNGGFHLKTTNVETSNTSKDGFVRFGDSVNVEAGSNLKLKFETTNNGNDPKKYKLTYSLDTKLSGIESISGPKNVIITFKEDSLSLNNKKITDLADGVNDKDAVNKSQLDKIEKELKALIERPITIKADKGTELKVKLGDTVTLAGDNNIISTETKEAKNVSSLKHSSKTLKGATNSFAGSVTISGNEEKIKKIAIDSVKVVQDGNNITVTPKKEKNDTEITYKVKLNDSLRDMQKISFKDSKVELSTTGLDSGNNPLINVKSELALNSGKTEPVDVIANLLGTESNDKLSSAATVGDIKTVALAGLTFKDDKNQTLHRKLSETLSILGDGNINTEVNGNYGIKISLDKRITDKIEENARNIVKATGGIATSMAMANIPQVGDNKLFSIGAGAAYYNKQGGFALGISGTETSNTFIYKLSAGIDTQKGFAVAAGFNINFIDKKSISSPSTTTKTVYVNDPKLQNELKAMKEKIAELERKVNQNTSSFKEKLYIIDQFINDKYMPTKMQIGKLKAIVQEINEKYSDRIIDITGHTDINANERYNLALGLKRANKVSELLVNLGLKNIQNIRKISSFGYNNQVNKGFSSNRRVEITVK